MNTVTQTTNKLTGVLDNLIAGKVDAATASAAASIVKAQAKLIDSEIAMARHGKLLDVVQAEWKSRLGQIAVV